MGKAPKIVSLQELRQKRNRKARKGYLTPEQRLHELEEEIALVQEFALQVAEQINTHSALLRRVLRRLASAKRSVKAS